MGHVVQNGRQVTGEVCVPRVTVDDVGRRDVGHHPQVHRKRTQSRSQAVFGQRVPRLVGACYKGVMARAPKQ